MSRLFLDDYARLRRRAEASHADEGDGCGASIFPRDGHGTARRLDRDRQDPSGRRGLTGIEFRRRGSA